MNRKKQKFALVCKRIFTVGCICAYLGLTLILCVQALKPGNESADISNNVGDKIDQIVTDISKPTVETVAVSSVEIIGIKVGNAILSDFPIELPIGTSSNLVTKVLPNNASNPALTYSSSNEVVAKAHPDGRIEAIALGNAKITATSKENPQKSFSVQVTVIAIPLQSFEIANIPQELQVGSGHRLDIDFTPVNTTQKSVTWQSSNETILTVNGAGTITAIAEGIATVTATSTIDNTIYSTATITVIPKQIEPVIPVESLTIQAQSTVARVGESTTLTAVIAPVEASDSLVWTSSDESVATINQSGLVRFIKAGSVTITVECSNYDFEDSITLTVKEILSSTITIETEGLTNVDGGYTLKEGTSGKIKGVLEQNATVFTVIYSSSDSSILSISEDGVIEALKPGTVTITATTSYENESVQATIEITVQRVTLSDTVKNFYYLIRKGIGHFGAFLVLGFFATFSYFMLFSKSTKGKLWGFGVCVVAGFAVASLTEILQLPIFTQGRHCAFKDVMIDFGGYCTSTLAIYLIIFAVHFIKIYKNKKNAIDSVAVDDTGIVDSNDAKE